ncbi:alpha/beta-hydrolase [Cryphonectria parasitica EP155]|uniref:Alpha/beta-hydrolase n=1 Tax=Cryphonectria parasitica (strain ATCC 38755 / EP155) TaxID=660469 RepID=A0A9P4Y3B3_CRYP1|nr:alpha/beta-hydrolase [Cryphonectria parasitica EP155]KAF3766192.1 alpha/beta-hydrolase [Cryphonectria parasitica EP155]
MAVPIETTTRHHTLPDGRILAYGIYGHDSPDAPTLLYLHGFPGSHFEAELFSAPARARGLRIVAPTRPGYSGSTHDPKRTLISFAADVLSLADDLHIRRFAILGLSGGAPFAFACDNSGDTLSPYVISRDRLAGVGILSGLFPLSFGTAGMMLMNRFLLGFVGPYLPRRVVAKTFDLALSKTMRTKSMAELEDMMAKTFKGRPEKDRVVIERDEAGIRTGMINSLRGAMVTSGGPGAAMDAALYGCDWGFSLDELQIGRKGEEGKTSVVAWHGGRDINVPVAMVKRVTESVPAIDLRVDEEEAHISLIVRRADDVLATMAEMLEA